ncbi:acyl-ACP--UDP-N-acetylglucosamine O-acyltransferase [Thiomicrospira microaerophila]|uniref:acyl-ACP--UDP-N-acetylglucosamine O-acyltransferase n=1 Tax=Thiomicrospira microaerophila TaxID=406020 RepID=UPI00200E0216|nr:acyl-ACP--UDP-N-acetylglucosamine O-acyltransferase [Thiomicrospira microaerophila]UQB41372.1 acyl-ACP--UDP-N-acetylglucosamine O-acyltransferase [Thiomicrospira microaerophila]
MIHPTAIIDSNAKLAEGVQVGAYCVIGADVEIDQGCILEPHVVISGPTKIGKNNHFYPFCSVGAAPQDKKYRDEPTGLVIGNGNTFRENVTLNRGTVQDRGETTIGDDNWVMAGVHIAHDCVVGNHTIFANATALAGHVIVEDYAILGGYTLVHQFCSIGAHSFCGMGSVVNQDVPNFVVVSGNLARPRGVNLEGLKRRGFTSEQLALVKKAYRSLYRKGLRLEQALAEIKSFQDDKSTLNGIIHFLQNADRGIVR